MPLPLFNGIAWLAICITPVISHVFARRSRYIAGGALPLPYSACIHEQHIKPQFHFWDGMGVEDGYAVIRFSVFFFS